MHDLGSNGYIVKEAKTHVFIWLCMVAWWTDDSKCFLEIAAGNGEASFDDTAATEQRGTCGPLHDVERELFVVILRVSDLLFRHV